MEDKVSRVTIHGFMAKHYDNILNVVTLWRYQGLLSKAIKSMRISSGEKVLDIGAGTGRNACLMHDYIGNEGEITGFDIEPVMIEQFKKKCAFENTKVEIQDIMEPFNYENYFDRVFISFVIHGFSRENREKILNNIYASLKTGGTLSIFDYGNFHFDEKPFWVRSIFRIAECPYAFEYIADDHREMLNKAGFNSVNVEKIAGEYVTLTTAIKSQKG